MDLLSVIIPVHNGEKYIKKTVAQILKQSYKHIELILVENFSKDRSLKICQELAVHDDRIRVFTCTEPGTSMARKRGILEARGKYIVFSDQDDSYINEYALEKMHAAITEDQSQICQFGYYKVYPFGIRKREKKNCARMLIKKEAFMNSYITGLTGGKNKAYTTNVWSKIYDADLLKETVSNIDLELYYAEDQYLNLKTLLNEKLSVISIRDEAYYVWDTRRGFSSNVDNALVLFDEYQFVKALSIEILDRYNCAEELYFHCHCETLYFLKTIVEDLIRRGHPKSEILEVITMLSVYDHVIMAKRYISGLDKKYTWEELDFLVSDYTSEEYYIWCLAHKSKDSFIKKLYISLLK